MTMRSIRVEVPAELADAMERAVGSGAFESLDELVQNGIRAVVGSDEAFDAWLQGDVAASCREMAEDPDAAVPIAVVAERLRLGRATRS